MKGGEVRGRKIDKVKLINKYFNIQRLLLLTFLKSKRSESLINDNDPDRLEFCHLTVGRINTDPNFLFNIVFSDVATLELNS